MLKKSSILTLFIISTTILIFIFTDINKTKLVNQTPNSKFNNFEISNIKECQVEGDFRAICAIVKNNSNKDYKFVLVKINLFDNNNNLVGNTTACINDLEQKQNWKFSAITLENNATFFQIKDIIGVE